MAEVVRQVLGNAGSQGTPHAQLQEAPCLILVRW